MSPEISLSDALVRSRRVVARKLGGEYLLVPLVARGADIDSLYNLNAAGTFVWGRLDGHQSGHDIVRALTDHFEVDASQATADYLAFVGELVALGAASKRE